MNIDIQSIPYISGNFNDDLAFFYDYIHIADYSIRRNYIRTVLFALRNFLQKMTDANKTSYTYSPFSQILWYVKITEYTYVQYSTVMNKFHLNFLYDI